MLDSCDIVYNVPKGKEMPEKWIFYWGCCMIYPAKALKNPFVARFAMELEFATTQSELNGHLYLAAEGLDPRAHSLNDLNVPLLEDEFCIVSVCGPSAGATYRLRLKDGNKTMQFHNVLQGLQMAVKANNLQHAKVATKAASASVNKGTSPGTLKAAPPSTDSKKNVSQPHVEQSSMNRAPASAPSGPKNGIKVSGRETVNQEPGRKASDTVARESPSTQSVPETAKGQPQNTDTISSNPAILPSKASSNGTPVATNRETSNPMAQETALLDVDEDSPTLSPSRLNFVKTAKQCMRLLDDVAEAKLAWGLCMDIPDLVGAAAMEGLSEKYSGQSEARRHEVAKQFVAMVELFAEFKCQGKTPFSHKSTPIATPESMKGILAPITYSRETLVGLKNQAALPVSRPGQLENIDGVSKQDSAWLSKVWLANGKEFSQGG